eukprot:CAMPEP_0180220476 /NCGR_PEP_ID=MMETSP0987-20121128/19133_1 /TAXON_ID=697907 /ORGANISM="non described non described, Strain CCMP2293" /LENGTH=119 /DNA_ID=CAMNT_0022181371 /DNA_START=360 /DNA_END=717 /DNA_ORIENTATION=+
MQPERPALPDNRLLVSFAVAAHRARIPESARGEEDSLLARLAERRPGYAPRSATETLPRNVPKLRERPALRVDQNRTVQSIDADVLGCARLVKVAIAPVLVARECEGLGLSAEGFPHSE